MDKKFILMPARHQHMEIDGLPSIFNETLNPFDLEFTPEFQEFISSVNSEDRYHINIFITGLTPALDKFIQIIDSKNYQLWDSRWGSMYDVISYNLYHFDRENNSYRTV